MDTEAVEMQRDKEKNKKPSTKVHGPILEHILDRIVV
jgi:hypothetical protein